MNPAHDAWEAGEAASPGESRVGTTYIVSGVLRLG